MKILLRFLVLLMLAAAGRLALAAQGDPLQEARDSLNKGEVKAAAIQLKGILQKSPDNSDARVLLGEVYIKLGDGASAVKELEKAKDLRLPKEKWIASLAQAYLLQNQAKTLLEKIEPDPQLPAAINAKVLAFRGMAQLSLKDQVDKSNDSFAAALQADPNSVEALMGLAMLEITKKDYKKAADYANQATGKDLKNGQAWALLAETKRLSGEMTAALDAYSKAIEVHATDVRSRLGRASVYIALGNFQEAQKDVQSVRKTAGDLPLALYTQAVIDFQTNKIEEAKEALLKVNNAVPDHLPTTYLLGAIAYQKNESEQAELYLSKVVAKSPGNLQAVKLLAATRLKAGHAGEAIDLLKPWAEKETKDAQLFAILGSAYLKNKQYDQGVNYLSRAAEIAPDIASVRAELGLGRMALGKMDQGVEDLKSAVNIDPKLIEADATIVLALIQQKKFDEAIKEANNMKAKRKGDPIADNLLGAAYMAKGDVPHAKQSWQDALSIKPDYTPANLNLAKAALSENNLDEAAKEYDKILKRDSKNLSAIIGLAQIAEVRRDYGKMADLLEEARQKNPKELMPAMMLTRYYMTQGKGSKALEVANEAVTNNPNNLAALQNLGQAQLSANQAANAVATFKQLVSKVPDNPELHHQYAQALYKADDKAGASKEWDEALKKAPEYIPALLAKAELAMQEKQYGDVMKTAEVIKAKFPKSPLGYQLEGDVQMAQKDLDKSITAYDKAYQLAPSSYLARRLFVARREINQEKAAFDGLRNWLEKNSSDADAWGMLGAGLQESGQLKEAATAYEKAYEKHPENLVLQNNLAWLYQEMGDKKALVLAEKLASTSGIENKSEILDTVGWIYLQNGKQEKGLVLLQQAALQSPRDSSIRFHLATAFKQIGKKEDARKELERLLKENKSFPDRAKAEEMLKGL